MNGPSSPAFEAEAFSIPYLTTDPAGFEFDTRKALGRTEAMPEFSIKPNEAEHLKTGMQNEMKFAGAAALREQREEYLTAARTGSPEVEELKHKFDAARTAYRQRGKKIGLTAVEQTGDNRLQADVSIVPFPVYRDFASPESSESMQKLSRASGVAMVVRTADNRLIVQHRGVETVRLHEPGKTPGNAAYADMPGASVAGLMDAHLTEAHRKPGTPDKVTTGSIRAMALKEAGEELGLAPDDFKSTRLIGIARDHIKPHDEFLMLADSKLSAHEVYENSRTSNRNKNLHPFDMNEKFFDIEASPQAIETLLCEVQCPLPPTHAADLVAAGYLMVLENDGQKAANTWRERLQTRVAGNYASMDAMVREHYAKFPESMQKVPERFWNKQAPARDVMGYTPLYTPEEQGLPALEDELVRTGLLPETRTVVDTAYLFDVDGVITDSQEKRVTEEGIFDELASRLRSGQPIGFNTGRSTKWVVENVITPLAEKAGDATLLHNAIVIGEKGCAWTLFDEQGQPYSGKVETLAIPDALHSELEAITARYADSMGNLDPKQTMFSAEMLDGYDIAEFHKRRAGFAAEIRELLHDTNADHLFRVDETTIATDVESPYAGKALGASRFLDFLKLRGLKAERFVAFGDSPSDLGMANELAERGEEVSMVYVGDPAKLPEKSPHYPVRKLGGYTASLASYLRAG